MAAANSAVAAALMNVIRPEAPRLRLLIQRFLPHYPVTHASRDTLQFLAPSPLIDPAAGLKRASANQVP